MRFLIQNRWSWQDWTMLSIRILWVVTVIILMYQDQPTFPFWMVFVPLLLCNLVPFLFVTGHYYRYLIAECLFAGGASLFLAYDLDLIRLFPPALFTIAFYSRGRVHWCSLPVAVALFALSAGNSVSLSLSHPVIWQSLFDALIFYGMSYALQKGALGINAIKEKLALIKEQYTILEQYSSQIERMTLLEERYRIARELHDTIGHTFTSLILGMETLKFHIHSNEGEAKLQGMLKLARTGLDNIRRQVHQMDPIEDAQPLDRSLLQILDEFKTNTGIRTVFRTMGEPYPVMKQVKFVLYRCLQEALTNASRHGQAGTIQVLLQYDHTQVMLQVQDNGKGDDNLQYGFGLTSMKERLTSLQGKLYIHSQADAGTMVTCTIPNPSNEGGQKIKILLADDQSLIRESLRLLLGEEQDFEVAVVGDGKQAIAQCRKDRPNIVLMDVNMPEMDGIAATKSIKETWPDIRIIMITTIEDVSLASEALRIGAEGYMLKSIHPKELAATIRLVYSGGTMISQDVAHQLFQYQTRDRAPNPYELTEREIDVLRCLTEGFRNKEIAQRLHLSEGTIRNYISSIYLKLQVNGREEAVEKAKAECLT
ncbi:helix-turn-helix transcriptional regulator [Aneurinibacillus migulanus]|uniref:DNA-binding response regulator, NarL/FixJ family, contains REC and HTH domains n=1 Tax=Aneurinibacillus migulanus TaxID=47500 RepID=A0A0D1Y881_ANEMI|nr:hybrid sensor histidine kinase/response regulator transcription factor [Aneurinibacillus migulanus]KIV55352.1 response regulator receiver protein [Aneurinibacillus migulanus]KON96655.1 response regulator receiver protein [Aneurinibacillus migulanus]MED0896449.1 hybrid sensor histidine kinase/response regulator transcription factor [Aneurinibacillus migulanus]MED1618201.1 hybrid sensor histidine kinase/response regulator transcription factor [Aneurinibacillus migulanus]SDJ84585.1 DNA-binding